MVTLTSPQLACTLGLSGHRSCCIPKAPHAEGRVGQGHGNGHGHGAGHPGRMQPNQPPGLTDGPGPARSFSFFLYRTPPCHTFTVTGQGWAGLGKQASKQTCRGVSEKRTSAWARPGTGGLDLAGSESMSHRTQLQGKQDARPCVWLATTISRPLNPLPPLFFPPHFCNPFSSN